jgi:hypothetical protein
MVLEFVFSYVRSQARIVRLDMLQLLLLLVRTMTHMEPRRFFLILLHNDTYLIIKLLTVFKLNIYVLSHRITVGAIAVMELFLLCKWYKLPYFAFFAHMSLFCFLLLLVLTLQLTFGLLSKHKINKNCAVNCYYVLYYYYYYYYYYY